MIKSYFNVEKNWVGTLCKPSAHIFDLYLKKGLFLQEVDIASVTSICKGQDVDL